MKLLLIHDIFNFLFLIAGIIIGLLFKTEKIHIGGQFQEGGACEIVNNNENGCSCHE